MEVVGVVRVTIQVDIAAVVLIVLGIALVWLELQLPGHHIPGFLGTIALGFGAYFAVRALKPSAQTSKALVIAVGVCVLVVAGFIARAVVYARRQPASPHPTAALVGADGVVQRALDPTGVVRAHGESWTARSDVRLKAGARVRVTAVEGLMLVVEPIRSEVGGS